MILCTLICVSVFPISENGKVATMVFFYFRKLKIIRIFGSVSKERANVNMSVEKFKVSIVHESNIIP